MPLSFLRLHRDACSAQGYEPASTEAKYAAGSLESTLRHWHELPEIPVCYTPDMSKKERKAAEKQYKKAKHERLWACNRIVAMEQARKLGLDEQKVKQGLDAKEKWGIAAAVVILIVGGPIMLFVTVVCAIGAWCLESELEKRYGDGGIAKLAAEYRGEK